LEEVTCQLDTKTQAQLPVLEYAEVKLDETYQRLLDNLGFDPSSIDELVERSGLTVDTVSSMLLMLESSRVLSPPSPAANLSPPRGVNAMKESVLDVLTYLFESYIDEDNDVDLDREVLQTKLLEVGFRHREIEKAFDWLEGLAGWQEMRGSDLPAPRTIRLYHTREIQRLDRDCRGFLMFLEQAGVLTTASRELVIDRVMALESDTLDLEQLKWIMLMVLFNLPGEEAAYTWLEGMVMEDHSSYLH
jgi:Smg protein